MGKHPEILGGKTPNEKFWYIIALVLGISIAEAFGQLSIKNGNGKREKKWLFLGIFFYSIVCLLLWKSYTYEGMGHVNLLWSCISIIFAYISGIIFYKEVCNKYTIISICLAFSAIYVSHLSDEQGN